MLNSDYAKAHAIAAATACLNSYTDLCLMADGNSYAAAIFDQLDRDWPIIAGDPETLAWYRSSTAMIRKAIDPAGKSIAPGSAARPAVATPR